MNIYVGNLSTDTGEEDLREAFGAFGEVTTVRIVKDGTTGESRGFGFVEMPTEAEANAAIQEMNGKEFKGNELKVEAGRARTVSPGFGGRRPRGQGPQRGGGRQAPRSARRSRDGTGPSRGRYRS
jgi:cold-inducible RNA-binding protein